MLQGSLCRRAPGSGHHLATNDQSCFARNLPPPPVLAGDDLVDYRKVYTEATKWCQDEYLAYQARRSRRLAYKRQR